MTIKEILSKSKLPLLEIEILLANVLNKDRSFINGFPETELSENQLQQINQYLVRRKKGEPVAYIIGFKEFFGRKFLVNKHVLIPRDETEELVEAVLKFIGNSKAIVADIGTGSGCVATSLACENPKITLVATDVSKEALIVAKKNALLNKVEKRILFVQSNLLENIDSQIDILVANLPYIPTRNYLKLLKEITGFEPRIALDSLGSKTYFYNKLIKQAMEKGIKHLFYEVDGKVIYQRL